MNKCQNCSKQYFCDKKQCEPVEWHKTKNYGIPIKVENHEINYRGISIKQVEKNLKNAAPHMRKTMCSEKEWKPAKL